MLRLNVTRLKYLITILKAEYAEHTACHVRFFIEANQILLLCHVRLTVFLRLKSTNISRASLLRFGLYVISLWASGCFVFATKIRSDLEG